MIFARIHGKKHSCVSVQNTVTANYRALEGQGGDAGHSTGVPLYRMEQLQDGGGCLTKSVGSSLNDGSESKRVSILGTPKNY